MKLSEHFNLREFTRSSVATAYSLRNDPPQLVIDRLQKLAETMEIIRRQLGGHPLTITSGYRSPEVNAKAGGVPGSDHMSGWACDFTTTPTSVRSAFLIIQAEREMGSISYDQLIAYPYHLHISIAPRMRGQAWRTAA